MNDVEAAARMLAGGRRTIVVKLGKAGALAVSPAGETVRVPALHVTPRDTTGAGDSFNAGLLAGWLRGRPLESSMRLAAVCGSLSTAGIGGTDRQPTLAEAEAALSSLPLTASEQ